MGETQTFKERKGRFGYSTERRGSRTRMRLQEKDLLGPAGDADSAKKTRQTNFDATHRLVYAQFQSGSPGAVTRQGSAARRHAS